MKVIILAAGKGRRMGPINSDLPKCLNLYENKTVLERLLSQILRWSKDITIVLGYKNVLIQELLSKKFHQFDFEVIYNPNYEADTNIYSLQLGLKGVSGDCIVFEADCLYSDRCFELFFGGKTKISSWYTVGKFHAQQVGAILKKDQNGLVEDLRILKEFDPFYSDYEKLIGVLKISGEQLEIYKKLLKVSLNNTYRQYYLQPWIDNLSLLPSTSVSLVPEFAEAFNTQIDLENIRAKNG